MPHLVLLGDSIFDNAAYVRGGPDVAAHCRAVLPAGWRATLAAVEGAVVADVPRQLGRGLPLAVCTVYDGNLGPPADRPARAALAAFNDVVLRTAVAHGLTAVELRMVCTEPADYANPIEPSAAGGAKIARAVARAVGALPPGGPGARVLAG